MAVEDAVRMSIPSEFTARELCSFYTKIGVCRHGNKCQRSHVHPKRSQTLLFRSLQRQAERFERLKNPKVDPDLQFDWFYAEVWREMTKYGEVEEMIVCANAGDHLAGNVFVRFSTENAASCALNSTKNRWFAGEPICVELSPVVDFRDSYCRQQFESSSCSRGGQCNFIHVRFPSRRIARQLRREQREGRRPSKVFECQSSSDEIQLSLPTSTSSSPSTDSELPRAFQSLDSDDGEISEDEERASRRLTQLLRKRAWNDHRQRLIAASIPIKQTKTIEDFIFSLI
ncbi:CCCH-type zinc finger transcription factor [Aphelenchoides besseyi]|nr:CCCH-type zinc finger transcription factor [Aphelenchoides besseyi]